MKRKIYTPKLAAEILAYRAESGATIKQTKEKFKISGSLYYRIMKLSRAKPKDDPAKKATGAAIITLLRKACKLLEREIRKGAPLRDSDSYVLMALTILEGN